MRRLLLLGLLLLAAPAAAQAPVPRPQAIVEDSVVVLGDLFEHAGPRAHVPLGPAPAPGRRFVVESAQLAIIARDNGLSWQPLGGDERVVVERPGRAMRREDVVEALRTELMALGADPGLDLEIPGFQPPMLPANAPDPRIAVDGASFDPSTKRFAANLVIVAEGMATFRQRVSGRAVEMRDAVVAARPLRSNQVITAEDVQLERLPVDRLRQGGAEQLDLVIGQKLRRALAAGQPVALANLTRAAVVARDATVMLMHEAPGLSLAAPGRALEEGYRGGTIPVMNLATGSVVLAEVLGPGRLRAIGPAPAGSLPPGIQARVARR